VLVGLRELMEKEEEEEKGRQRMIIGLGEGERNAESVWMRVKGR